MTWETVPLRELARVDAKTVQPDLIPNDFPYVGLESIGRAGAIDESIEAGASGLKSAKNSYDARHVLFGKLRPNLGKVARPSKSGVCSTDIYPILPSDRIDRDYLAHFLLSPEAIAHSVGRTSGVNLPRVAWSALGELQVPLPPLPEQRRIAAILDEADALRWKARSSLSTADTVVAATFTSMFGSAETWDSKPLAEVVRLYSGGTPSKSNPELWGGDVPWFSPKDMKSQSLYDSTDHVTLEATATGRLRLLPPDTVTVVVRGMILAHTLPVTRLRVSGTINQDVKALLPRVEIDAAFLASAIRAQSKRILGEVAASGHGTKRLDTAVLASLPIPRASRRDQLGFRRAVDSVEGHLDRVADRVARLDALFASLQRRAFRREL